LSELSLDLKWLVLFRFGHVLMLVALLAASGTHWAALQSVAWATMLAQNWQSAPLTQALEKTFDGKHPCPLCKVVAAGKAAEQKSDFALELKKLEYPPAPERFILVGPSQFRLLPEITFSAEALTQEPPVPVPRSLFV